MRRFVIAALVASVLAAPAWALDHTFLQGADASFLPQVEAGGGVFRVDGVPDDLLAILADHGVGTIRLRLWHTPGAGHNGLAATLALAERIRDAGCALLLDFHYSDTWADPGHQTKPAAWAALPLNALADSVRSYTCDVLTALDARDAAPTLLQLGNEITAGLLWNDGRVGGAYDTPAQWAQLATLLQAAIAGVDDAFAGRQRPDVMIHIDRGADNAGARWYLDNLAAQAVEFDVIGLSYYPWWHGTLADLGANLDDLATRYEKDLILVETAYPWTLDWFDDTHNIVGMPEQLLPGYPATPQGQAAFLATVLDLLRNVPEDRGRGVFWWAPEWISSPGFGSAWENVTFFDRDGEILPALAILAGTVAVEPTAAYPDLRLAPNPFNPLTTIAFTLSRPGHVSLQIFDCQGRLVHTLLDGDRAAGTQRIVWRGHDDQGNQVASGTYLYRLQTEEGVAQQATTLIK